MYCKNCGKLIDDNDKYCAYCGFAFVKGNQIVANQKSIYEKIIFLLAILGVLITLLDSWLLQDFYFKPDFITYLIAPLITYIVFIYAIIKKETKGRIIGIAVLIGCMSLSLNAIFYNIVMYMYIIDSLLITPIFITIFYIIEYCTIAGIFVAFISYIKGQNKFHKLIIPLSIALIPIRIYDNTMSWTHNPDDISILYIIANIIFALIIICVTVDKRIYTK